MSCKNFASFVQVRLARLARKGTFSVQESCKNFLASLARHFLLGWLRLDYRLSIINISFAICELIAFNLLTK